MKSNLIIYTLLLYFLILIPCSFSDSLQKKKIPLKFLRLLNELTDTSDTSDTSYGDYNPQDPREDPRTSGTRTGFKRSSGLSAGAIVGIVIPCVLVVVGVGVAAAFIGSSAPAAGGATAVVNPNVDLTTAGINNAEAIPSYQTTAQINND